MMMNENQTMAIIMIMVMMQSVVTEDDGYRGCSVKGQSDPAQQHKTHNQNVA